MVAQFGEARFVVDCRLNPGAFIGHVKMTFVPAGVIVNGCGCSVESDYCVQSSYVAWQVCDCAGPLPNDCLPCSAFPGVTAARSKHGSARVAMWCRHMATRAPCRRSAPVLEESAGGNRRGLTVARARADLYGRWRLIFRTYV